MTSRTLNALRRIRWAVRGTLAFGVSASVAANTLHADPNPISQSIAAWPPLALLLTVELVSRVPVHRRSLAGLRVLATVVISGIAAWVSYWHMAGVASHYGETDASPYLLPVSVDGLIVVASISLVELAGRIRDAEAVSTTAVSPPPAPVIVPDGPTQPMIVPDRPAIAASTPAPARDPRAYVPPPPPAPPLSSETLDAARIAAAEYRQHTGRDITRDALRDRLRVSNALAGELLRATRAVTPGTPARLNRTPATVDTPTR